MSAAGRATDDATAAFWYAYGYFKCMIEWGSQLDPTEHAKTYSRLDPATRPNVADFFAQSAGPQSAR